ncbi:MAG: WD40/YVTN/BNR-like repeat-containing protein, partial [Thermoanaerobaculia bacterium]
MTQRRILLLVLSLLLPLTLQAQIDPELLAGMKARSIGPAAMSGRVAAIEAVESDSDIVYVGAATGGVWKSVDGAYSFTPVFDDQPVAAIGAVAVFQASPEIVWVGTGEGNPRNSVSVGNGVYKSVDGGTTWQHMGLEKTERIHRIVLHPRDPNIAWVAAMGQAWGQNADRGVFKTTDGGKTWTKVLYVDERTGAADLVIDPANPNKLFAAMWEYRRWPWFFNSGGPGSGLHVSYDGGATWKRFTEEDGMPKGALGRIGIGIARSNPNVVYALVEADKSALLRSDDGGRKWTAVNTEYNVANRPFYYADIRVDPKDPNRVYNVAGLISVSTDGGRNFKVLVPFAKIHPDYHALWIDPNDPARMYSGNDGGVAESRDRGTNWRYVATLPLGQYYHIAVDNETPYNVYGGMQDNGSWKGPNTTWETGGIRNSDWQEVGFGDGFATMPIPGDSMVGYSMSQEGYLMRWNMRTGERKDIRPVAPQGRSLRFNWNTGIAIDPFNADGVYYGSQYLHRSANRGDSWTTISPDLTTNRQEWQNQHRSGGLTPDVTGAENYTTIITIAPSPRERGVIWVGTDDGRVHVTRDDGANWTSVEGNIRGVPANTWVPEIKASRHTDGTAFIVLDDHRRSNLAPYVYRTTDYGKSWTSLATKDLQGYALSIEQDPIDPNLLFLGTEFGLWISKDAGKSWVKWKHGFPTVSVMGLAVHPRDHDLVIGTHGRAAYVLDDIRPLRTMSKETLAKPLHFFEVPDAQAYTTRQKAGSRFVGDAEFRGENEPYGALLTYSLNLPGLTHPIEEKERQRKEKERAAAQKTLVSETGVPPPAEVDVPKGPEVPEKPAAEAAKKDEKTEVDIEIADATGTVIRHFKGPANLGVNRTSWGLQRDAFKRPPTGDPTDDPRAPGIEVPPGVYTVTLKFRGQEASHTVHVVPDPRERYTAEQRQSKYATLLRAGRVQETATAAIERIQKTRADIDAIAAKLKKPDPDADPDPLVKTGNALKEKLDRMERRLWTPPKTKGIVAETDVWSKIQYPLFGLQSSWDEATPAQIGYLERAETELRAVLVDFNKLFTEDVAKYREDVRKGGLVL